MPLKTTAMELTGQPLQGLTVIDQGQGMPIALVAKFLREMGARVIRINTGPDPFDDVYTAHRTWRSTLEHVVATGESLETLLAGADICLLGGEDFPGLTRTGGARQLVARHDRLVVLEITAYPDGMAQGPSADILLQARAGLTHEQYSDRATLQSFSPTLYSAALLGLTGLMAALIEREGSGRGQAVFTSLYEGALLWGSTVWSVVDKPCRASEMMIPKDLRPLIFQCSDGVYVQLVLGAAGAHKLLYDLLGIDAADVDPESIGMPSVDTDPKDFLGDVDRIAPKVRQWSSTELIPALKAKGLAAESVLRPGDCWDDEQVAANGLVITTPDGGRHIGNPVQLVTTATAPRQSTDAGPRPLDGIRVVDFGTFIAGPYSSVLLGDLGADVISVEPPGGNPIRGVFRVHVSVARGKRGIVLDMKKPGGLEVAHRLCATADMAANNFRPGVSARLGIDAGALLAMRPDQVVLESPGYGATGPRVSEAAFDMSMQAICGHEYRAGGEGNPPLLSRFSMIDYCSGLLGTIALLIGHYQRVRTGGGSGFSVALFSCAMFMLSELIDQPRTGFSGAPLLNSRQTGYHPAEALYQVRDGWIAVAARDECAARDLVRTLDVGTAVGLDWTAWGEAEFAMIGEILSGLTVDQAVTRLTAGGVWAEACIDAVKVGLLDDPHHLESKSVQHWQHPTFGKVRQVGALMSFSRSKLEPRPVPPKIGEHSRELLGELGYTPAEIDRLFTEGAVA